MKSTRFDAIARATTRRGALRALVGGVTALALGRRTSAADPGDDAVTAAELGLGYTSIGFAYDSAVDSFYTAYYRQGLLDGAGRFCSADAAIVGRTASFRAVCTDRDFTGAESLPTLLGAVTVEGPDGVELLAGTCRKRAKRYGKRIVLRCNIVF